MLAPPRQVSGVEAASRTLRLNVVPTHASSKDGLEVALATLVREVRCLALKKDRTSARFLWMLKRSDSTGVLHILQALRLMSTPFGDDTKQRPAQYQQSARA